MAQPTFFRKFTSLTLAEIAMSTKSDLADAACADQMVTGLASLDEAGPGHLAFFDNIRYVDQLAKTRAGAVLVNERHAASVPPHVSVLRAKKPFAAFVQLHRELQQDALRPQSGFALTGIAVSAVIHATARLEDDVTVDPLAVIGPDVEIGSGSVIGSGAVIAAGVKIGRDCNVGAGSTIQFALIGNNVLIHPGCRIGQDGFGFIYGAEGHLKVPQAGRVLIQNNVEIGAGTSIDRGSLRDTIVGEGTKIDNQVQIGHNVTIGRHCLIAAKCGLAGSLTLGDNVVLGAMVGLNNHITIGDGAQVTAMSGVKDSIPARGRWGGFFAKPTKQWFREILAVEKLGRDSAPGADAGSQDATDEGRQ
ncbi:UDP-3-O-(3-hydroxymyristoyl)glucosamine N-acyltransferase [Rhodopseudomonas sp. P2A-2r]|uniref:UDP-3-O-(3-hydroxymyristoyl)glucosamine N-acyltransferase n=1 Tax=Rhodopseudomonas sp. P2A-2r TaxID=2991972 RepID=UPI0022341B3B|nr:UDP-3-O-(3-hydroxymyristoyl)glucosamine N-acyltransferase [Rhodopseudomonas sp. P2A-2r]UZE47206.1 UDP-3-O-(3-hydroxymyristoyl)glucosamine N-acyltransferase [Rhodopseudomonas sp. P2A-2r]